MSCKKSCIQGNPNVENRIIKLRKHRKLSNVAALI